MTKQGGTAVRSARRARPLFWIWVTLIGAALLAGWWASAAHWLDWRVLAKSAYGLRALAADHLALFIVLFSGGFIAAAILLWPAQLWLIVLAGFVFGLPAAFVVVWTAAMVGAVAVHRLATLSLGDAYGRRHSRVLQTLQLEFGRDPLLYMLVLRWLPISPYAVANVVPPLLGAPLAPFLAVATIGVLPDVVVYSLVGATLATALDPETPLDLGAATAAFLPMLIAIGAAPICWLVARRLLRRHGLARAAALEAAINGNRPAGRSSDGTG